MNRRSQDRRGDTPHSWVGIERPPFHSHHAYHQNDGRFHTQCLELIDETFHRIDHTLIVSTPIYGWRYWLRIIPPKNICEAKTIYGFHAPVTENLGIVERLLHLWRLSKWRSIVTHETVQVVSLCASEIINTFADVCPACQFPQVIPRRGGKGADWHNASHQF